MYKSAIINFGDFTLRVMLDLNMDNLSNTAYLIEILDLDVEEEGEVTRMKGYIEGAIANWDEVG